ncbi:YchJ family metal-binding protein [Coraliomargarita sp. SDUM461004]|uniref:YchJ family metal-binding protein n=1 Tax=Thalassobacterium sedimentorum TaxID=3041258 RepID=A0ABU1ALC0_9BACT|nr:YchJ family metal-binding protein [Coraliomargarita sp. SDUM461004]MDQ8195484.1 YchJ family metal-binding protein [Coraliomargarita sp. SDUM461004]
MKCPCESGLEYSECCQDYHAKRRNAPTAEALMRARYAAYVRKEITFLVETTHPTQRDVDLANGYSHTANSIQWIGLEILQTLNGAESDNMGKVEFRASYIQDGQRAIHHEKSRFKRYAGKWYYLDGYVS